MRNAISTAIDNIITPGIEVAVRSKNASSGRDAASVAVNSKSEEGIGTTSFEIASERNNTSHELKSND